MNRKEKKFLLSLGGKLEVYRFVGDHSADISTKFDLKETELVRN
jgi:hypothetical protein